ncbi:MAG: radical SAM protein [bacterium]|nr:radical SAM protein [bacterium]
MISKKALREAKQRLEELDIPMLYDTFPQDYHLHVNGWSFPDDKENALIEVRLESRELEDLRTKGLLEKAEHLGGNRYRIRRLRTLDIEIGPDEAVTKMNELKTRHDAGEFHNAEGDLDLLSLKKEFAHLYMDTCVQRCPHCFNQEDDFYVDKIIHGRELMKWSETLELIIAAKRLGLESVKFLGIGEVFKNPALFDILDDLERENIAFAIFTKGVALGDDETARNCNYDGVESAEDLVKKIDAYKKVSILLGANSFYSNIQDEMVGCQKNGGVKEYSVKRNRALHLLIKYGFNDPARGRRLALIAAPITPRVSDETLEMFEWGARRNIPVVTIPTMVSGKGINELDWLFGQFETDDTLVERFDPQRKMTREQRYTEWLVDLYTDIYERKLEMGITTLETLKQEGISGYAGTEPCQQKHNGMYVRLPGVVQECPGRCVNAEITGNIREEGLMATWIGSANYDRGEDCNSLCAVKMMDLNGTEVTVCDCCEVYKDVGTIPPELEARVIGNLEAASVGERTLLRLTA